jgi:hypothetical protein
VDPMSPDPPVMSTDMAASFFCGEPPLQRRQHSPVHVDDLPGDEAGGVA